MLRPLSLYFVFVLFLVSCIADQYYYESVSYVVETSSKGTFTACSLQIVSLQPDLSSLEIIIPYSMDEFSTLPIALVGKTELKPEIVESGEQLTLRINFSEMKVGEMEYIRVRFTTNQGVDLKPGSRVEVKTLGLGGNITAQALNLKLPKGLTVARIETQSGVVKPGSSGDAPITLGRDPVSLIFFIRRATPLDNPYVVWGIGLGIIGIVAGYILYRRYRSLKPDAG